MATVSRLGLAGARTLRTVRVHVPMRRTFTASAYIQPLEYASAHRGVMAGAAAVGAFASYLVASHSSAFADTVDLDGIAGAPLEGKVINRAAVSKHDSKERRVWVTYKSGVYDVTDFVESHPGGEKILLGAGGAIDPYWKLYAVHNSRDTHTMLESFRIGTLPESEWAVASENDDGPYSTDPERLPIFTVLSKTPFNAEPPKALLAESYVTPSEIHFKRNHLPVPQVDPKEYRLTITGKGLRREVSLSLEDLRTKFKKIDVTTTLQCAGNRRKDMSKVKPAKGLKWDVSAISTAVWSGAPLRDVLKYCGIARDLDAAAVEHIQFEGIDADASAAYGASIPVLKAMNPDGDVILAYEMNGTDIPRDHGYPVRAIVPGVVAARSVKWLKSVRTSKEESSSLWQQKDYKIFPSSVEDWSKADFNKYPAMQETPVISAICVPGNGASIKREDEYLTFRGYAYSGGGLGIQRVELSLDGGHTWTSAELQDGQQQKRNKAWAWTLWDATVPIPKNAKGKTAVLCRAIDSSCSSQPEKAISIWNIRGLANNSWHTINVNLV